MRRIGRTGRTTWIPIVAALIALSLPSAAQASGTIFYGGWYDDAIGSIEFDGSNPRPNLVVDNSTIPEALAASGDFIYWESNSSPVWIGRSRLDGSEVKIPFISAPGGALGEGLSASSGRLYWTETRNSTGFGPAYLSSASLDGSDRQLRILSLGHNAGAVVVTGDWVFYVTEKNVRGVQRYSIARRRLDGKGSRRIVAANRPLAAHNLTVSGSHVYWLEEGASSESADFIARASLDAASINTRFRRVPQRGCHVHSGVGSTAISGDYFFLGCPNNQIDRVSLKGRSRIRTLSTGAHLSSGPVLAATP